MSQSTKRALAESFEELLRQKPFHKITVSDIAANCGVNRMTFYYHFHDVYDLTEWIFEEDVARLLDGKLTAAGWREGLLHIMQELQNNRQLVMNICRSVNREVLERYLCKSIGHSLEVMLGRVPGSAALPGEDRDFILSFYTYAVVGLTIQWIESGMEEEPQALLDRLDRLAHGSLRRAVDLFSPQAGLPEPEQPV